MLFVVGYAGISQAEESRWAEDARTLLDNAKSRRTLDNIKLVAKQIASLTRYSKPDDLEAQSLRKELVEGLISIPGHAQFFADEIERTRLEVDHSVMFSDRRNDYDSMRSEYLTVFLPNLPSPETIQVLGHYLYDDRDPRPISSPKQDWASPPPNMTHASTSLAQIGLREPPVGSEVDCLTKPESLAKQRAWFEDVKTGKRTFSFKGQTVEYRFKPDGTWDTIPISNPPDDGIKLPKPIPKPAPEKSLEQPIQPAASDAARQWLPWLWIPALAIAAAGWWRFRRRGTSL